MKRPRSQASRFSVLVSLIVLVGSVTASASGPGLGEISTDCTPGFQLAAMPIQWTVSTRQTEPLTIVAHVAIDFDRLPRAEYRIVGEAEDGEPVYDLAGYPFMVAEASIHRVGEVETTRILSGLYTMDEPKKPVVFTWDGRDGDGRSVAPGLYEVDVRGRFVPASSGLTADDLTYADLRSVPSVAEMCTRPLTVEVVDDVIAPPEVPFAPPAGYYDGVDASDAASLRATLHDVIDDHWRYPYSATSTDTWDVLNDADENPSDDTTLLTVYRNSSYADGCSSGCAWNREHSWAKSYGFSEDSGNGRIPYTDCHHLRASYPSYNSSRSNLPFNVCDGCSAYPTVANNGFGGNAEDVNRGSGGTVYCDNTPTATQRWEVWNHRKGDIARGILYMDIRYEGGSGVLGAEQDLIATDDLGLMRVETTSCGDGYQDPAYIGVLSTLIAWSEQDPPDDDERRRNDAVFGYQQNRNPFVDHPEWVACLYQGLCNGIFGDDFEGGDTTAWDATVGGL